MYLSVMLFHPRTANRQEVGHLVQMRLRSYTVLDAKAFPSIIFHKDLIAQV
jgi:hypothetical protein